MPTKMQIWMNFLDKFCVKLSFPDFVEVSACSRYTDTGGHTG